MRINVLIGGQAGQGPNILADVIGKALVKIRYYVFCSRDYQSLIKGGHNFNVLTFSEKPVYSNDSKREILIGLDKETAKIHEKEMKKDGIVLEGDFSNMFFAGKIAKILGLEFKELEEQFKKLGKRIEENIEEAKKGYESETIKMKLDLCENKKEKYFMNGSQGIAEGAIKSGLNIYYAYPMTPATPLLSELANSKGEHLTIELENEIAVINAGVGSAITGDKAMIGSSGGGFDLMTEAISMTGQAEIPLVAYLAMRPGPGTGVATYTSQGDLQMARHCGHGEFQRLVVAPGDPTEAEELTSQCFYFSQKYKIPAIIISDKHLAESFYTCEEKAKITKSEKTTILKRYNSYENDIDGSATENPEIIKNNFKKRIQKQKDIEKEVENFEQFRIYGNKNSKNIVVSWGSTKGAILDAIKDLDIKFIQILYIEPFPKEIKKELGGNLILIENNSTGQLGEIIAEKTGIFIEDKNKILRYDGRPFLADELREEIRRRIK